MKKTSSLLASPPLWETLGLYRENRLPNEILPLKLLLELNRKHNFDSAFQAFARRPARALPHSNFASLLIPSDLRGTPDRLVMDALG